MRTDKAALAGFATAVRQVSNGPTARPPTFSILAEALFRRRDRRSSTIDEGIEDSKATAAFLHNVRTRVAERLAGKPASPATDSDIVHRVDIANHRVAVLVEQQQQRYLLCHLNAHSMNVGCPTSRVPRHLFNSQVVKMNQVCVLPMTINEGRDDKSPRPPQANAG